MVSDLEIRLERSGGVNLFEEANRDIERAIELQDIEAAFRVARDALGDAADLGEGELLEQLDRFIRCGQLYDARNVITALGVKQDQVDRRNIEIDFVIGPQLEASDVFLSPYVRRN